MSRSIRWLLGALFVLSACGGSNQSSTAASTTSHPDSTTPTTELIVADSLPLIDERPTAPTGLVVVDTSDGAIELSWDPSRSETVTGYEIIRVGAGITQSFTSADPSYRDEALEDGDIYTYAVAAVNDAGTSPRSEIVTARVGVDENPPTVPGRPRTVDSDDAAVALTWRASEDLSGVASYVVTRTIDDASEEFVTDVAEFIDDGIEPGVIVTYRVLAIDVNGNASEPGRSVTVLSGSRSDDVVIVVSAAANPADDPQTARLRQALLDAGFVVSWFEDDTFDANLTDSGDVVLLLGDVEGEGFDWNIFSTDSTVIGLKSMFVEAAGITENPPKLDRLAQLNYGAPGTEPRRIEMTTTSRPKPVVYIPPIEQTPDLEIWARPTWSDEIAVAGLIPAGAELATEKRAPGCRAFFPGNSGSLAEQTNAAWELLIDFVGDMADACS